MLELVTGVIVTIAALVLVAEPLFSGRLPAAAGPPVNDLVEDLEESRSPEIRALLALKEIEFDRATGKISEEDYVALRQRYGRAALSAMEQEDAREPVDDDAVDRAVAAAKAGTGRACPDCGDRPELAAVFCSACGRSLVDPPSRPRCWMCGEDLPDGAQFCGACGHPLAA